jgi:integrase
VISEDPSSGLRKFSGGEKKRGILTPSEVQSVFSVRWYDYRAKVGNLIAATCGLRSGEILGLRFQDIQEDRIHVKHSMSRADGLKKPKNGETRVVPLLPAVRKEILALMKQNPFGQEDEHFIFFSEDVTKPMSPNILRRGLERALVDITLSKKDRKDSKKVLDVKQKWKDRGICVHSWRHYYATNLADRIDMRTVQLATGHKSGVMAEHYADHANAKHFQEIAAAAGNAFGNFIEFPRGETESHKEAVQ